MRKRVLVIQNDASEDLGLYEVYLRGCADVVLIRAYAMRPGGRFPSTDGFDAFVVGPTPISANDVLDYEFLREEWGYLRQIIGSGKPVLGVCCGGQMLARLLGGEVRRGPGVEVGGYTVSLTDSGCCDPLFSGFPRRFPVFHWHEDVFTVPPGGRLLATGSPCEVQAYAKGNVRGVLFHLEVTAEDAVRWADAYPGEPAAVGKSREQVLAECGEAEPVMRGLAGRLVGNLLSFPVGG